MMPQATEAEIRMCFTEHDGGEIEWNDNGCFATTFTELCAKADGRYGVLVVFKGKASMTMGNICHEASHVLDYFMNVLPLAREPRGHNEHLSYLLQWIGDCMNRARLGQGELIEIKAEKDKADGDNKPNEANESNAQ